MAKALKKDIQKLYKYEKELDVISQIENMLVWDQHTIMPEKASPQRAEQLIFLSELGYKKFHAPEYEKFIAEMTVKNLARREKIIVKTRSEEIDRDSKIPFELVERSTKQSIIGYEAWVNAKDNSNFKTFAPHLKKLVSISKEYSKHRGVDPYDDCLMEHEDTTKKADIEEVFAEVKDGVLEILGKIKASKRYKNYKDPLANAKFDIDKQRGIVTGFLETLGMDVTRSTSAETVHPFQTTISRDDKRLAVAYREGDLMFGIGAAIHEYGHLLYELGINKNLAGSCLADVPSMSLHESQSRLWERHIGLSQEFCSAILPSIKKAFPGLKMSVSDFYFYINRIKSTPLRLESDELHYPLHIIIRYELEKDLLGGKISVHQLPEHWNRKYKEYIGVKPKNDAEGVLQDCHWSDGSFGYFPSYTLGDIYATMFWGEYTEEHSDDYAEYDVLTEWLRTNIHQYGGTVKTNKLIKKVCGREIDPKTYLESLRNKYYDIYL